mgnify:CR=1 FL=1|jgi:hypothetical protein
MKQYFIIDDTYDYILGSLDGDEAREFYYMYFDDIDIDAIDIKQSDRLEGDIASFGSMIACENIIQYVIKPKTSINWIIISGEDLKAYIIALKL